MSGPIRSILCFGDSNTWGFDPSTTNRYPPEVRWPGIMASALGESFHVIEEGLNGRTTVWDDPLLPGRNGKEYLVPCLDSHRPLDTVILFLGTNDVKKRYSASAQDIAKGVGILAEIVARSGAGPDGGMPVTLIMVPPPLGKLTGYAEAFEDGMAKSLKLGARVREIAAGLGCEFLDTSELIATSDIDGVHFGAHAHAILGRAVAAHVRLLSNSAGCSSKKHDGTSA